jgi:DNA-binding NarL/FixJ family response regulator
MRTVLLIDDSPVARHALSQRLAAEGFHVVEASSAEAALGMDPSLVISCAVIDLELAGGGGDGADLAAALLERRGVRHVAFFTMGAAAPLLESARARGPVFLKPDVSPVVAWVKQALSPSQPPPTK